MPFDDLGTGLLEIVTRFIRELFMQVVVELLLKGPGCLLLRYSVYRKTTGLDCDRGIVIFAGILFWLVVGGIGYVVYQYNS